jgi:ferredoxin
MQYVFLNTFDLIAAGILQRNPVAENGFLIHACLIAACMFWVPDEDHPPYGRIQVDPLLCIGCKKCTSKGPDGCFLDGCPGTPS